MPLDDFALGGVELHQSVRRRVGWVGLLSSHFRNPSVAYQPTTKPIANGTKKSIMATPPAAPAPDPGSRTNNPVRT